MTTETPKPKRSGLMLLLPPKSELKCPISPAIEPHEQPIVVCKPGAISVVMPDPGHVVLRNTTDTTQPGELLVVPAIAVAAMKVNLKDAARLASGHIRQFFKELGF